MGKRSLVLIVLMASVCTRQVHSLDLGGFFKTTSDVAKVAAKTAKGVAENIPQIFSPEQLLEFSKQSIIGLPAEAIAATINQICSVALLSNATASENSVNITDMNYILMTEDNNVTIPLLESDDLWKDELFNKSYDTVILVTGWTSNVNEPNRAIDTIYNAYKARGGYNFVVIDTAEYVDTLYTWSAFNTNDLGEGLADGLKGLIQYVPLEKIHLIGSHKRAWELYAETVYPETEKSLLAVKCNSLLSLKTGGCIDLCSTYSNLQQKQKHLNPGRMEVASANNDHLSKRWNHLRKILERSGPFCHPNFTASSETLEFLLNTCKILVIGAGGLGCELLKDLALMGFRDIHVIDMDTIELSNLNRQFLFRRTDIGKSKAQCAAAFINGRVPGCVVTPHFCKIQDFDSSFYRQFHIIVCGLDSIVARRWINGMLISMLEYEEDGSVDETSVIPLIDGGTEGFKGNARVILPGMTACIDCTLDLFPPQVNYPLCTIANTPRLPEHCIEYVKIIQWPKETPFGVDIALDGDDPQHVSWVYEKAQERANSFNITGLSYRLVQGVLKNIIPAVASTNAVIAAACATEVFKIASSCCEPLNNYMVFNDVDGIYTYTYEAEKRSDCLACSQIPRPVEIADPNGMTLQDLIQHLCDNPEFQMKSPGLTAVLEGKNKTLYMGTVKSIEEATKGNLTLSLNELGLKDGQEIMVADITTPNTILIKLKFQPNEIEMS
uniref:NEDD8-activating enzyme E1 catalytic subunit n=2 Tax=Anopheles stephensi TaxID=30069 RepID=A0A182YFM3_ANOST